MLAGIMIGQRTPGHSTAEAVAFETRIHQRYVDYIGEAGWDYLGVYSVEGLVPGAFAEVLLVDAADPAEAMRRDAEHDAGGIPADVAEFYDECRRLFWQRGRINFWIDPGPGARLPRRGEAVRLTFAAAAADEATAALPWRAGEAAPAPAVRLEVLGPQPAVAPDGNLLPDDVPALPAPPAPGTALVLRPLVPAPERTREAAGEKP